MNNIVIFGGSGHAKVIADIITLQNIYNIIGVIAAVVEAPPGIDYLGADDDMASLIKQHAIIGGIIAIGDAAIRRKIAQKIISSCPGFLFITAIHPSAIIASTASVGAGSMVTAGAIINPYAKIGEHCIVNTSAIIEHDSVIDDFVNISPSVTIGGNVHIHTGTTIGMGTNILPDIHVGEYAMVGAGALVCSDVPDGVVAYGVPARIIKKKV